MKRIFILALFFNMILYPASLKSGVYKAEYYYSKISENKKKKKKNFSGIRWKLCQGQKEYIL